MRNEQKSCRICGSNEHYLQEVRARGGHGPDLLPIGFFASPRFQIRVSGNCGLVDWFVPEKFLEKVKEKFTREI
jgi:hypothetical protein